MKDRKIKVLFICLGNICRSPAAEGAFINLLKSKGRLTDFEVDSCGTSNYHIGDLPDVRTRKIAEKYDIELTHRARQLTVRDLDYFDFLLVMDSKNYQDVLSKTLNPLQRSKIHFFRGFSKEGESLEVPDPYYGTEADFDKVQNIVMKSAIDFLNFLDTRK
ncbi:MAG: low molecular weight phosphotyrosine protein phosphatase [Leptospira sp.]|jgi:protein-tyrosine phosphatase|nr:low molecular weight phosphotyrosine protein phosphatase [Leptospira sp.]